MAFYRWDHLTRDELARIAPAAVVVLPIGAVEQHGPHLATATDALLVSVIAERACASSSAPVVLTPTLSFGASDHHLAFGATLSLSTRTLLAVLDDLLRSVAACGFSRVLLLNGHGGNAAVCTVAATDGMRDHQLTIAVTSYWEMARWPAEVPFPGHGGMFETSLMLATAADQVRSDRARSSPSDSFPELARGMRIKDPGMWERLEGFTDDPRDADSAMGERWLAECVRALAARIDEFGAQT